ncbi:hypothetical protein PQZ46_00045 [bacterium]|jgi:hypothetical protein|nr:hypothetical protein [bacterium]
MKLNELLQDFVIFQTNEESEVLERLEGIKAIETFSEREQAIIENLIRKSLVSKVQRNGSTLVMVNEL